jgi:diguanylate cyclase (GGDEF)-like protein
MSVRPSVRHLTGESSEAAQGSGGALDNSMAERLRSDTTLATLSVFSILASMAVGSFAVYRLSQGEWLIALLEGLLVMAMLGCLVWAWVSGRSLLAGSVISTILALGALFLILTFDLSYLWVFSLMIGVFLMADLRVSVTMALLLIGVIAALYRPFAGSVERFTFLAVALQVAAFCVVFSFQTSRQRHQLNRLANRDPLTGLGNRRALRHEIAIRVEAARRGGESAAAAMIDLDHFKAVNDRHGHEAGDRVLKQLADIARDTMRACDRLYRYGGEEFVLIMRSTPPDGMLPALEKLQEAMRERLRGPDGVVTVSMGAAAFTASDDPREWLSRADRALYAAKAAGRDRICLDHG